MSDDFDPEALKAARAAAGPGERVLWAGRPGRRLVIGQDLVTDVLAVPVVGGVVFLAVGGDDPVKLTLIVGVALVAPLVRLALAIRRAAARGAETYAVTDRRVMILRQGVAARSIGLERADAFRLRGRTLWLDDGAEALEAGRGMPDGGARLLDDLPRLTNLRRPERVWAIVRQAAYGADQPLTETDAARGSASKRR